MRTSIYGWLGAALLLALAAGCAAERLHRDGMAAIDRGEYEQRIADRSRRWPRTRATSLTSSTTKHAATGPCRS